MPLHQLREESGKAFFTPLSESHPDGFPFVESQLDTGGLIYADFLFRADGLSRELLPYGKILSFFLGRTATQAYSRQDLSEEAMSWLGGLEGEWEVFSGADNCCVPMLSLRAKALAANHEKLFALAGEILPRSRYEDFETAHDLAQALFARVEGEYRQDGHRKAMTRALAPLRPAHAYQEEACGLPLYWLLKETLADWEGRREEFVAGISQAAEKVLTADNAVLFCSAEGLDIHRQAAEFFAGLPWGSSEAKESAASGFDFLPGEGIIAPIGIQFGAAALDFHKAGYPYQGGMKVLAQLLNSGYLLEKLRLEGGAYDAGCQFSPDGTARFFSYRDPGLAVTRKIFQKAGEYIKAYDPTPVEFHKLLVGTLNQELRPLHPYARHRLAVGRYFTGFGRKEADREREELLNVSPLDIREMAALLDEEALVRNFAVVGSEEATQKNSRLFSRIWRL